MAVGEDKINLGFNMCPTLLLGIRERIRIWLQYSSFFHCWRRCEGV